MNKLFRRFLILAVIFLAGSGILIFFSIRSGGTKTEGARMGEPVLPTIAFFDGDTRCAPVSGYVKEMQDAFLDAPVAVLTQDRTLNFCISARGADVTQVLYALRSEEDGHLIEDGTCTQLNSQEEETQEEISFGDLLEEGKEYRLTLRLKEADGTEVYYYTLLFYEGSESTAEEAAAFVLDFSEKTFSKDHAAELAFYLEQSEQSDDTDLGHVTISSTRNMVTWGSLSPVRVSDPLLTIQQMTLSQVSLQLNYEVQAADEDGHIDTYRVREFFCIRMAYGSIYLLTYDRTMEQVLDPATDLKDGSLDLGIQGEGNVQAVCAGEVTAFIAGGEVWEYLGDQGELIRLFSFRGEETEETSGPDSDVACGLSAYGVGSGCRILSVQEDGTVDFLVYGYMDRGSGEGLNGLFFYRYDPSSGLLSERIRILSDLPAAEIENDLSILLQGGADHQVYLFSGGALYAVDLNGQEYRLLADGLTEGHYVVSSDGDAVAWEEEGDEYGGASVVVLYVSDGSLQRLEAEDGELLRVCCFIRTDLVYEKVRESDKSAYAGLPALCPAYALEIRDREGNLQEHYEIAGIYLSDAVKDKESVQLTRVQKTEDGGYSTVSSDKLLLMEDLGEETEELYREQTTDVRNIVYSIPVTAAEKTVTSSEALLSLENEPQVLAFSDSREETRYYGWSEGQLICVSTSAAKAVQAAYEECGYVRMSDGRTVWNRESLVTARQVSLAAPEWAPTEGDSEAACLKMLISQKGLSLPETDVSELLLTKSAEEILEEAGADYVLNLKGITLKQVLCYLNHGDMILVMYGSETELITGYDSSSLTMYDPVSASQYTLSRSQAEELFAAFGNNFLVCR